MSALLAIHAFATLSMTGLIWFVQVVHYPLFARVGPDAFAAYEREHQHRTTVVVAPLMLAEAIAAAVLVAQPEAGALEWIGAALVVFLWASTALVQVPLHRRLDAAFDARTVSLLVRTNWLRTLAWTARAIIALVLLGRG